MADEWISFDQRARTERGRRQARSERLHDKIAAGERSWSPERGEAVAQRLGLPPFEVDADPANFDPEREPRWTLAMALAWIIWRTPEAVRDHWEQYRAACLKWNEPRTLLPLDGSPSRQHRQLERLPPVSLLRMGMRAAALPGVLSYPDAVQALIREMQDGAKLRAVGVRPNHERSEIQPHEWIDLEIHDGGRRNREDIYLSQKRIGDRRYTDVRIERQKVVGVFPAFNLRTGKTDLFDHANKGRGGRRKIYPWSKAEAYVRQLIAEHGMPSPDDPELPNQAAVVAKVIKFCADLVGQEPAYSLVKLHVSGWLKAIAAEKADNGLN